MARAVVRSLHFRGAMSPCIPHESRRLRSTRGFTLVEVIVALGLVAGAATALAQLASIAVAANMRARTSTTTIVLAQQKMEELLSEAGVSLSSSPAGALTRNVDGCFDFVDRSGHLLGGGPAAPAGSAYLRRWSIEPRAGGAGDTLILQVLVTDARHASASDPPASVTRRRVDRASIVAAKARKAL